MNPPPDGPFAPQEPLLPGPGFPGGSPGPAVKSRPVSLAVISEAYKMQQVKQWTWAGATIVYVVILGGFNLVSQYLSTPSGSVGSSLLSLLISVCGFVLGCGMQGGLLRMAIRQAKGGIPTIGDLFGAFGMVLALVVAAFLTELGTVIGLILLIIPGLYVLTSLSLALSYIVDRRMGAIEAFSESMARTKGQLLNIFVVFFFCGLLQIVGAMLCGLGLLITFPILELSIAIMYRNLSDPARLPIPKGYVPPIADPNR